VLADADLVPAVLQLDKAPDQSLYNPGVRDIGSNVLSSMTVHRHVFLAGSFTRMAAVLLSAQPQPTGSAQAA
jgi:hypothetical protein